MASKSTRRQARNTVLECDKEIARINVKLEKFKGKEVICAALRSSLAIQKRIKENAQFSLE